MYDVYRERENTNSENSPKIEDVGFLLKSSKTKQTHTHTHIYIYIYTEN